VPKNRRRYAREDGRDPAIALRLALLLTQPAMADYFTSFSCVPGVGSHTARTRALELYKSYEAELDRNGLRLGFELEIDDSCADFALWMHSDDCGDPGQVVEFVLRCAEAFHLKGRWGFTWSYSCSKPRVDAFGGGAYLIDLTSPESIDWIDTGLWLANHPAQRQTASRRDARKRKRGSRAG
jgi:hypothetical protein